MTLRLLCTDLDGTLIPNGCVTELPSARNEFAHLITQHDISLAYVSGRDQELVRQVIGEYQLPDPHYVIADVGSSIYACQSPDWTLIEDWQQSIGCDWAGQSALQIHHCYAQIPALVLQESAKQGRFKLSFYVPFDTDRVALTQHVEALALQHHLAVSVIYSMDEQKNIGLLDILPAAANKLAAIRYLMDRLELMPEEVLFAGDSGNDMDVLSSELPAVLVANAHESVRQEALRMSENAGLRDRLYLAHGALGNGHYADGIIEGMYFYFPELRRRGDDSGDFRRSAV